MPIKGLSDRIARFPRLGIIHKGAKKEGNRPGSDLDYFRLDTPDPEIAAQWTRIYGEKPDRISCLLPYASTDEVFQCWLEEWNKSCLVRRCDGTKQCLWLDSNGQYSQFQVNCFKESDTPCTCKEIGRLHVVLPDIKRLGYFEVQTHSKWDIMGLTENLLAVELSAGKLSGIPFLLKREIKEITVPINGKKSKTKKSLLSLEVHPDVASKVLSALEARAFKQLTGDELPRLSPVEDWVEKGLQWATSQGIKRDRALSLMSKCSSKQEFFETCKTELAATQLAAAVSGEVVEVES